MDILDRLGADAVAAKLRLDLRVAGMSGIPAPRRATTRTNPAGLTAREVDVVRLLGEGLTNGEIATRLFVLRETVDHHGSAMLTKLGLTNRREAARVPGHRLRRQTDRPDPIDVVPVLRVLPRARSRLSPSRLAPRRAAPTSL